MYYKEATQDLEQERSPFANKVMNTDTKHCNCGLISISPKAKVLARFVCHCQTCQNYTGENFNDESFFQQSDVSIDHPELIDFNKASPQALVSRGKCKQCAKPVISIAKLPLKTLILIPSPTVTTPPAVCSHVFYHRRVNDINDGAPKYSGHWTSQAMTLWFLLKGLLSR